MSLTDTQKAQVRQYLGYPDVGRSCYADLEGAMSQLSAEGVLLVAGTLTQLGAIDGKLEEAWDRQKVTRAEEITLAGPGELRALRAEGRRLARRTASLLGVRVRLDVFGGGGSSTGVARRG